MPVSARIVVVALMICGQFPSAFAADGRALTGESDGSCHLECRNDPAGCSSSATAALSITVWPDADVTAWLNAEPQWLLTGWVAEVAADSASSSNSDDAGPAPRLNPAATFGPATSPVSVDCQLISQDQQLPADADAEEPAIEVAVADLFEPMRRVAVAGPSSIPPVLPDDAAVSSLQEPTDRATDYMESTAPVCYFTQGYGVRRAPRNTWRFYCHPLYYEEVNLERCGRSKGCCTTACSALHFASRAAITPYLMTLQHHDDCVRTLPDCPTCHEFGCEATCPAWSWKAALVQGAAVTGLVYAIP